MHLNEVTAIILSGGKSTRMGVNKAFVELMGKSLIEIAIERVKRHVGRIAISANTGEYDLLGYPVIPDRVKNTGPAGGLLSCFSTIKSKHFFVLSCDMPFIPEALIPALLDYREGAGICLPSLNGFIQPLCGYYSSATSGIFRDFAGKGNYKMMDIVRAADTRILKIEDQSWLKYDYLFNNINTPADLEAAKDMLNKNL